MSEIAIYFKTFPSDFNKRGAEVLGRAKNIFVEKPSMVENDKLDKIVGLTEEVINLYIKTGQYPEDVKKIFERGYVSLLGNFLKNALESKDVKIVFERTAVDGIYRDDAFKKDGYFFTTVDGKYYMEKHLSRWDKHLKLQEESVAQQILNLDKPVAALLDYHRHLFVPSIIGEQKNVEVIFPSENYPLSYDFQMRQEFRKKGSITEDLYLRRMVEFLVQDMLVVNYDGPVESSGICADNAGSCKLPLSGVTVKVFDRNDSSFQTAYGTKNPSGTIYDQVYENGIGQIATCITDNTGTCIAGEEAIGTYLVIVKYQDAETGKTVYAGRSKSPEDFVTTIDGLLATKDLQILKIYRKNGQIQIGGGSKTVITGSYIEVVYQDLALWEQSVNSYTYPFVSDSSLTVDLCTQVPRGYSIVGIYNSNGDFITTNECTQ